MYVLEIIKIYFFILLGDSLTDIPEDGFAGHLVVQLKRLIAVTALVVVVSAVWGHKTKACAKCEQ